MNDARLYWRSWISRARSWSLNSGNNCGRFFLRGTHRQYSNKEFVLGLLPAALFNLCAGETFQESHWQVDGEGRLCVGEELVLPYTKCGVGMEGLRQGRGLHRALMGRGDAMPSNISSPRYLPALVVSL